MTPLVTVGHGTLSAEDFLALVCQAGIEELVDIRTAPGSRRHPHFARQEMERWVPEGGVSYRWERSLGGFRKPSPDSPNTALRHPSFRGYADHMAHPSFASAVDKLLEGSAEKQTAVMCSETLWWRCHRRLLADAVVLGRGREVMHLLHDGKLGPHHLTQGVRQPLGSPFPVYDAGQDSLV